MTAYLWQPCSIACSQCHRADQGGLVVALESYMQTRLMIIGAAAGHVGLVVSSLVSLVGAWKTVNDSDATAGLSSEFLPGWGG
jgi:hypothetical protein